MAPQRIPTTEYLLHYLDLLLLAFTLMKWRPSGEYVLFGKCNI